MPIYMDRLLEEHTKVPALKREDVQKLLLAAGWPKEQVNEYIKKTFKEFDKDTIIQIQGVSKSFGENHVLKQADLEIKQGDLCGLIGLSGAGKTTLLNILVGFIKPDAGEVTVNTKEG